ncbi:hypothetical protein [Ferrimonas sp. SCSIO 43195]|uniref:hypothetical protein n=1 Tax=Ferrimonas sp. SCSIO 43195 TaxID=2822844 RepID=UPI0020763469|nr:hypothetical protein [Ferrimonas sp. SCSIO 43195]USD37495.1 hypothetical protein J8Z22_21400 [Ferrimonas sp. SCSIO 43195]
MHPLKLATLLALTQLTLTPLVHAASQDIELGGFVRANYGWKDYSDASKDKGGDFAFDAMSVTFDGKIDDIGVSVDYRFASGLNYVKRAYGYMDVSDTTQVQVGVVKVPFGKPGFISNSYWFSTNYYLGFEDNYDAGVKVVHHWDRWQLDAAFIKGPEYGSDTLDRYGADIIGDNEETNQLNLRAVYSLPLADGHLNLGGSLEAGQLYHAVEEDNGDRWAAALHADWVSGPWNLQAQVTHYQYNSSDDADTLTVGVVGAAYDIASEATGYNLNLSRRFDTRWGNITLYNDYGLVVPEGQDQDDSTQNVLGLSFNRGPIWAYFDYIVGNNMTFAGGPGVGLANPDAPWDSRININVGYYF